MAKTVDRRVRRSKKSLGNALLALVIEKPFGDITVQDIADRADMNRATFYLHFQSKEELLLSALEELFDELVNQFGDISAERPIWEDNQIDRLIFQHVADYATLYKALLDDPNLGLVIHQIISYVARHSEIQSRRSLPEGVTPAIPLELMAQHVAGSLFALIHWWLRNGMPYSPEYMANATHQLWSHGCAETLMGSPKP